MLESVICFGTVCIIVFILYISIAVWIYKDAESRGMSGILWVMVVFLLGLIGLIIYLLVRNPMYPAYYYGPAYQYQQPPQAYQQPRPQQREQKPDENVMGDPRVKEDKTVTCNNCGAVLDDQSKFCGYCGAQLK